MSKKVKYLKIDTRYLDRIWAKCDMPILIETKM